MSKIIVTLTGHKNCGKEYIAEKLDRNTDAVYIKPYTDKPVTSEVPPQYSGYHFVKAERLDKMIEDKEVLSITEIGGNRYVYFKDQLTATYNVLIVDDYGLVDIRTSWKGKLYTIKVKSENEIETDRVGEYYYNHEFDEVYWYDNGDFDELEARISSIH